jgi:phosphate transport system substrate-binding protein
MRRVHSPRISTVRLIVAIAVSITSLTVLLAACGGGSSSNGGGDATTAGGTGGSITGAGASFPYPLYSAWASDYNGITGVKVNYQSIGSSGGIEQIKAKTVDFGASDAPLSAADLDAAGLIQFPMTVGGVAIVVNLDGIADGQLKLDGPTLADIFMGKIAKWDDTAIAALNPGVKLPATDIGVVHRADGSGTTWIFTSYLSAVSPSWKSDLGAEQEIAWPVGIGGKGSEGVAQQVKQIKGSIGYVEYAYAKQIQMTSVQLQNKDGQYVAPSLDGFAAAAANADWATAPGLYLVLVDQPGATTYPIAGASFILIYKEQADAAQAKTMLKFFDWAYKNGAATATKLDYVAMPQSVVTLVEDLWTKEVKAGGSPVWP